MAPAENLLPGGQHGADGPTYRFADFRILQEIHRSSSGAVYKAEHRASRQRVVLKEKKAPELGPGKALDSEAVLLTALSHPNVIRCYGSFHDSSRRSLFIVLEDASGGDLQTLVRRRATGRQYLTEEAVLQLFVQVARGVEYLHAQNIVHRDIKALNVVLDGANVPKVCDLGVSRLRSDETVFLNSFHGTPLYLSPELVDNEPYTEKTDVWSLGVLLYQLAALRLPFEGNSLGQIIGLIKSGSYAPLPASYSRHLTKLLDSMLHRKPSHRPTLPEIVTYCEQLLQHLAQKAAETRGGQAGRQQANAQPVAANERSQPAHAAHRPVVAGDEEAPGARGAADAASGPPAPRHSAAAAPPPRPGDGGREGGGGGSERSASSGGARTDASERDERLRRRAAEFAAHHGGVVGAIGGKAEAGALPSPQLQPQPPPGPGAAAAGGGAAAGSPLRVLPLHAGACQPAERRGELGTPPMSGAGRCPGILPSLPVGGSGDQGSGGGGALGAAPRAGESARQQLLGQREEERRRRLVQANVLQPPSSEPASSPAGSRAPPSAGGGSVADSEGSAGAEREMYALAARMHRLQLEAALWKEPWKPSSAGGQAEQTPPPLPTPPALAGGRSEADGRSDARSESSQLSRRSYNIFTHQWEETPIGGRRH